MTTETVMAELRLALGGLYSVSDVGATPEITDAAIAAIESAMTLLQESERNAALAQASALTQDQYADTVNPLIRSDNG